MFKICETCGKEALRVTRRSHSNIATIARQNPNLQTRHVGGRKILMCAQCIKQGMKKAA